MAAFLAALAVLTPGLAATQPLAVQNAAIPAAGPGQAHQVAESVVAALGGERPVQTLLDQICPRLAQMLALQLSLKEPSDTEKLASVLRTALSTIAVKANAAAADTYATNFSLPELQTILAFARSPAGRAEVANLPGMTQELAKLLQEGSAGPGPGGALAEAPPVTRDLVRRLVAAKQVDASARKALPKLNALMEVAAEAAGLEWTKPAIPAGGARKEASPDDQFARAASDYAKWAVSAEERFYLDHFSQAELGAMVAFYEGPAGQAVIARAPLVRKALTTVASDNMSTLLPGLVAPMCAAIQCSPEQQRRLDESLKLMARMAAGMVRFT